MSEREQVLEQHRAAAAKGDRIHQALSATLASVRRKWKREANTAHMDAQLTRARAPVASFFWNYNTVEAVLLFCAVLVNLAGVMFQSGQLDQQGFEVQKGFVTWVIVLVIVISIVYFFIVLFSEIYLMVTVNSRKKKAADAKNSKKPVGPAGKKDLSQSELAAKRRAMMAIINDEGNNAPDQSTALNPLFLRSMGGVPAATLARNRLSSTGSNREDVTDDVHVPVSPLMLPANGGPAMVDGVDVKELLAMNQNLASELASLKRELAQQKMLANLNARAAPISRPSSGPERDSPTAIPLRAAIRRAPSGQRRSFHEKMAVPDAPAGPTVNPATPPLEPEAAPVNTPSMM